MVTLRPYGVQTQASGISQLNSGGNGYIGNAGLQLVGQALGGAVERGLGIDNASVQRQQAQESNRNQFEAEIERREQVQYTQSQRLAGMAQLADLDIEIGSEAENLKSKSGNGGQNYTKSLQGILNKKVELIQKNLSFEQKQFLEPQLMDFKNRHLSSAMRWERTERINNDLANVEKYQKSLYDRVNDNPESVNEAKTQMNMLVDNLIVEPSVKRKLLNDFDDTITQLHYDYRIQTNPEGFLSEFKKVDAGKLNIPQSEVTNLVFKTSEKYNVDPLLMIAIQQQENPKQIKGLKSTAGAIGEMQLMLETSKELSVDPYNTEQNIDGGVRYFSQKLKENNGDVELALASYNAGYGNVKKYGGIPPFKETQDYVKEIMQKYQKLKASQDTDAGVIERKYAGKALDIINKKQSEMRSIAKENERQQGKQAQEYAEKAKYYSDIISKEDLDAEVENGRISYKNANVIKKAISSIEKQKAEQATDKTKIEILKNQSDVNDVLRNNIINSDIPEKEKLEIVNFIDDKIDENKNAEQASIKLAINNGDLNYKDIADNANISDADKLTYMTAQKKYDTNIAKSETQAVKKQKEQYNGFVEKIKQEIDNDFWSVDKLNAIRDDLETADYDTMKKRIEQRDEEINLPKYLITEPKGSDLHTKAVNNEFNKERQNIFDASVPVEERTQNAVNFLEKTGGVVPSEFKSIVQNMALKPNADNVEFINGVYQNAKLSQDKAVLNNLSEDVALTSNIYQSYLDTGNSPQQALSLLNEELNLTPQKRKERGELGKDIIREPIKNGKSFIEQYGDTNTSWLGFFGDDYSSIKPDSDVYSDLEADAKEQFMTAYVKTGNKEQSLKMAFDYIGKTYSKFNDEYMKYAPDVATGFDAGIVQQHFNEKIIENKEVLSLSKMLGFDVGNIKLAINKNTEKAFKTRIMTKDGISFKTQIKYNIIVDNLPLRNREGNVIVYSPDVSELNQIHKKEIAKELVPLTLPRG